MSRRKGTPSGGAEGVGHGAGQQHDDTQPNGWWAVLVYLVVTFVYAYPALAGRFLVNPRSDQFIGGFPVRDFATAWERAGHGVPLWNPYIFGGMPYVASMNGDMFYPTALLRLLLGTDVGMTWGFVVHVFLAGCFAFLFLRRAMRLGFFPSLVGGLAYMAGGNVAGLVSPGHDGKLYVAALLPLALFYLHRGIRDGRRWAWGALALVVALALLSPHPQLFQYFLLAAGAYALFLAFSGADDERRLPRALALQRLGLAFASVALGTIAGAIQYLPLLEYTPWSPRAGGKGYEHAVSYSMPPEELLNTYLPQFSGILDRYAGRNIIHFHSEYIGAAVLVLATLAFGARQRPRRVVWFWAIALVVGLLWSLGGYTPFFKLVYALVPGTTYFRAPSVMLYFVAFCAAVLAAIGVERALTGDVPSRRLWGWVIFAIVVDVLAFSGALGAIAETFAPAQSAPRIPANRFALILGALRSLVAVCAVSWIAVEARRGRRTARQLGWLFAAVVGLDLWSVVRSYWNFSAPAAELYASDPVIEYLKHLPEPGRVVPLAIAPLSRTSRDPYFGVALGNGDGFMVHGVRSAVGYHGNELGRYYELTGWEQTWPANLINGVNLLQLLNIQYIYTNTAMAPLPNAKLVAGPAKNAAGNTTYLFRLGEPSPMAWVAPLAVKVGDAATKEALLLSRFDVRRVALFDSATAVPTQPSPDVAPEPLAIAARVTTLQPGHIVVALDAPAPANATLVVSENYYPGWRATVDGRPAAVGRADYVLMGVGLPAGARQVELTFTSDTYQRGKTITIVAVVLMLIVLGAGIVADRRPTAATT